MRGMRYGSMDGNVSNGEEYLETGFFFSFLKIYVHNEIMTQATITFISFIEIAHNTSESQGAFDSEWACLHAFAYSFLSIA